MYVGWPGITFLNARIDAIVVCACQNDGTKTHNVTKVIEREGTSSLCTDVYIYIYMYVYNPIGWRRLVV